MSFAGSPWASGEYDASPSFVVALFLPRIDPERTQVALSRRQLVQGTLLCTTSQRTFRLRHTRQALGARRFAGAAMSDAFLLADSPCPDVLEAGGESIAGEYYVLEYMAFYSRVNSEQVGEGNRETKTKEGKNRLQFHWKTRGNDTRSGLL